MTAGNQRPGGELVRIEEISVDGNVGQVDVRELHMRASTG